MKKVFITGASGCVGHYLFDLLAQDPQYYLYLLVRNPNKLKFNPQLFPKVEIIQDDLKNIKNYQKLLSEIEYLIHLAADWGGHEGNYDYSLALFESLNPEHLQKVIYFSTASILDAYGKPLPEAEMYGTNYIQSKYRFYQKLPELKIFPKVITLFPTWVLGGDQLHPYSHALQGILELRPWFWLIRFFTAEAHFHFIHAQDLASITKHLLENETTEKNFILGNPAVSASQFIREVCHFYRLKVYFQIPITPSLIRTLAFLLRKKLHPWDLYCLKRKNFTYPVVDASTFGINSRFKTIEEILQALSI